MSPNSLRFLIFFTVISLVLILFSLYLGYRMINRLGLTGHYKWIVWLTLGIFIAIQVAGPYFYRMYSDSLERPFALQWMTYTTLGVFSSILMFTLITDLGLWLYSKISSVSFDAERRLFFGVSGLSLASVAIGGYQALKGPKIFHIEVPIKNLPLEFEGFKIAQISDLHVGPLIDRDYAQNVVQMTNSENPDVICVTGDLVDGTVDQLRPHVEPLANFKSNHGVYYCTGNHEYYWDGPGWINHIHTLGGRVLNDEHIVIEKGLSKLALGGVTDISAQSIISDHVCSPAKAFENAPQDAIRILMAHQPNTYTRIAGQNIALQISGHTHGGQYYPWKWIVAIAQKYYIGLNRHEDTWIYVNRGTGYWGPPHRFGVPSEITMITLKKDLST